MGNSDETKTSKPEKPSSPPLEQTSIHVYPDWAAMQAYYGPRVAVPPYFNSAVAPGHAPHSYMWGPPQPMMAPYGSPYAAIYAHGGVYAHPGVSLAATPNPETPTKSSGTTDQGLMKKLKGFDGLAMSIGNGNADSAEGGANHTQSQSTETEGSSDGSNGNSAGAGQYGRKRSREETPTTGGDAKTESVPTGEVNGASDKVMVIEVPPSSVAGNVMGNAMALELKNPPNANAKASPTNVAQPYAIMPNETWLQNEREMKRERRKQSNRESARRSRLRKQDKLKGARGGGQMEEVDDKRLPLGTENLLSRVDNSGSVDRSDEGSEVPEKNSKSGGAKLRQLLSASPRTDAVAAG
ncbi:common plant regulatory factor 1-like isoform X2 [Diospyros lotus]|uniref:common plant regulatory factor 1-like isoform X2 n=1 Tax=Diospyros lotus TaxID=55363 RepID=UPI00225C3585|nr:common plant regulatory factor 1-like isoform X2 [Diospyros lotus]